VRNKTPDIGEGCLAYCLGHMVFPFMIVKGHSVRLGCIANTPAENHCISRASL
jgi:hypothetical protein